MIDLENMERLAKKADPLPWEVDGCNNIFTSHNSRTLVYAIYDRLEDEYIPSFADTTYIVAACNAVPELIQRIRELEEEADCHTLHWTNEPPKKSGWYYFRGNIPEYKYASVVYVDAEKDRIRFDNLAPWSIRETVKKYTVEFAGPLPEPVEESNA